MLRIWSPLLAAMMLLAGCSGDGGAKADDDESKFDDIKVEASDQTGVIRGVVVDETIVPVAGATVTIQNTEMSTETNDDGAFGFSNVEPGTYFLEVSKIGFETVQTSTEVVAGVDKPPILKIQVATEPGALPFVVPFAEEAFISCGFKTFNWVWDAGSCDPSGHLGMAERDDSVKVFSTGVGRTPHYFQSEIDWEFSQPLSAGLVTIQCLGDSAGCGSGPESDRLCNVRGTAPLVCRIDRSMEEVPGGGNNLTQVGDGAGFQGDFAVGLFSNCAVCYPPETPVCVGVPLTGPALVCPGMGFGLAIDQSVQVYVHVFYNFEPEDEWLFIEDGAPAVPEV